MGLPSLDGGRTDQFQGYAAAVGQGAGPADPNRLLRVQDPPGLRDDDVVRAADEVCVHD